MKNKYKRNSGIICICDNCKNEFIQKTHWALINKHNFCSRDCYYEWRKDYKNCPRWNGGEVKMLGYVFIFKPDHPFANDVGYIKRSRYIMEQHMGRYLTPEETIHHINEIRNDDRIENLLLCSNGSEHLRIPHKNRKRKKQLEFNFA